MKVTLLCSSTLHPIYPYLIVWIKNNCDNYDIDLINDAADLSGGDILFLISCVDVIKKEQRDLYEKTLVIHAGDLPAKRGWSPHVWQILEGSQKIIVTLFEAEDRVDAGDIWTEIEVQIPLDALYCEINQIIFGAEIELIEYALNNFTDISPKPQNKDVKGCYYRRRTPNDSKLDVTVPIEDQFNLLRISDPYRYPAFFEMHGYRYKLIVEKIVE